MIWLFLLNFETLKSLKYYGMLSSHFEIVYSQIVEGVKIKVLHREDSLIMTELMIKRGSVLPEHVHQNDHSAYLLQGKIRMVADGIASEFVQGDSWCIYKDLCHQTEALEDSVVLEVFNPDGELDGFQVNKLAHADNI